MSKPNSNDETAVVQERFVIHVCVPLPASDQVMHVRGKLKELIGDAVAAAVWNSYGERSEVIVR